MLRFNIVFAHHLIRSDVQWLGRNEDGSLYTATEASACCFEEITKPLIGEVLNFAEREMPGYSFTFLKALTH